MKARKAKVPKCGGRSAESACPAHERGASPDEPCVDDDGVVVCCAECGGGNVEYAVWYDPNKGETNDEFGSWNAGDNTFCHDCDDNTDLVDCGAEPARFAELRRMRRELDDTCANCGESTAIGTPDPHVCGGGS